MSDHTTDGSACVRSIRFSGHATGFFKHLRGFRKGQHTVPDAVSPTTLAFLARLCTEELTEEAETLFQSARQICDYKRRDLALDLSPPAATLTARNFSLELMYSFDGDDATSWRVQRTLSGFTEMGFLRGEACSRLFAGRFSELIFSLTKGAAVESVIDAVEGLEGDALRVDYPSDYSHCLLAVEGVDARVRFDGAELAMLFSREGAPNELLDGFLAVQQAFSLTKSKALSGLLG